MPRRPEISIVGAGRFGSAAAVQLKRAGYRVREIVSRSGKASTRRARGLARRVGASAVQLGQEIRGDVVWICVPDGSVRSTALALAKHGRWTGRVGLHASGVLASRELQALRDAGASVASVHPLMTFVSGSEPSLKDVPFAIEGDARAVRVARELVHNLGAKAFPIEARQKGAYHAWGAFSSPLLVSLLVTAEEVARMAGVPPRAARRRMMPILEQTLRNYARLGPAASFSGPLVRGDTGTITRHLEALRARPEVRDAYLALAVSGLRSLPARNRARLMRMLKKK